MSPLNIGLCPTDWLDAIVSRFCGGVFIVGFKNSLLHAFAIRKALNQSLLSAESNGHGDPKFFACTKDGYLGFCAQLKWSPFRTMCVIPKHGPSRKKSAGCKCVMILFGDRQMFCMVPFKLVLQLGRDRTCHVFNQSLLSAEQSDHGYSSLRCEPKDYACIQEDERLGFRCSAQLFPLGTMWVTTKYCPF